MRDLLRKLLAICERGDQVAASAEAWSLQSELTLMLNRTAEGIGHSDFNLCCELDSRYHELGFPDLLKFASGDLGELSEQARLFEDKLRQYLTDQSVDLGEISTLDELEQSLQRDP